MFKRKDPSRARLPSIILRNEEVFKKFVIICFRQPRSRLNESTIGQNSGRIKGVRPRFQGVHLPYLSQTDSEVRYYSLWALLL